MNGKKPVLGEEDDQYEEDSESEDEEYTSSTRHVANARNRAMGFYDNHSKVIWVCVGIAIALLYFTYFAFAMEKSFDVDDESIMRLLIVTIVVVVFIVAKSLWPHVCPSETNFRFFDDDCQDPGILRARKILYWLLVAACIIFIIVWVVVDIALNRPENLISLLGMLTFILLFFIFSHKPHKVNWRPVFWGLILQFFFALLILRSDFGFQAFDWLGKRVEEFLLHSDAGSKFVFGDPSFLHHYFAFKVLPVIIFFSSVVSVLYYWGVMQFVIRHVARFLSFCLGTSPAESLNTSVWLIMMDVLPVIIFFSSVVSVLYYWGVMQFVIRHVARFLAFCLGTSPAESLNAAGNIFIGQTEAPLMVRPFLKDMTKSELHAICTGGFATIAGGVMAAFIAIDVPANHLLSASVMSAPAALAMSKLFWPESKKNKKKNGQDIYKMEKGTEHNFIEAASNGASLSIKLIANIAVNLIAFIALLHFIDQTLIWIGHRIGWIAPDHRELTFNLICRYLFFPIAWLMGVTNTDDTLKLASMIGTKTFLNEFVAYTELSVFIKNTETYNTYMLNSTGMNNGTYYIGDDLILNGIDNTTRLIGGIIEDRSVVISTYALCGFSNISSIGIQLGALGAMAPTRKRDLTKVVVRAMIAGNVACFMTASIAGLLYQG